MSQLLSSCCIISLMRVQPARRIRGHLRLPGDKSISHRAAIISALAEGRTRISNFSTSEDCAATLACLGRLGVSLNHDQDSVRVEGVGPAGFRRAPDWPLDCGNSGSTMRLLAGVLAGQNFVSTLTGDSSLRARPMKRIIEPLEMMGARVLSDDGHAPLFIEGRRPLAPLSYEMLIASAQVKSCILLAALNANGRTEVVEKLAATRDHTERMLRWFGVTVETRNDQYGNVSSDVVSIEGPAQLSARDLSIPGDISSAAFFIAAAAMLPGSELEISDLGLNPTRTQILWTLLSLGADVSVEDTGDRCNEPFGHVRVRGGGGLAPRFDGANVLSGLSVARLIDELPVLAVVGTQLQGGLTIREAAELRVKETDRIAATAANLRAMGAEVEEYEDGLSVAGRTRLRGAALDARGDHRIAMAFAIAALTAEGESEIEGAECVTVSFPEFFRLLESVVER